MHVIDVGGFPESALGSFSGGDFPVEFSGLLLRDAQCLPFLTREMLGKEHNLSDVVGIMADLAIDSLHHRMRFRANGDGSSEIRIGERIQGIETDFPARLPQFDEISPGLRRSLKFGVAVAIRFLTIGSQEIGPAGTHVAGHVLYDDGDGVGLRVEGGKEVVIGALLDGAIAEPLVITQKIASILGVGRCEVVGHGAILSRPEWKSTDEMAE